MHKDVLFAAETRGDTRRLTRCVIFRAAGPQTEHEWNLNASGGPEPWQRGAGTFLPHPHSSPLVPRSLPPGFQLCQIDCCHRLALVGQFVA